MAGCAGFEGCLHIGSAVVVNLWFIVGSQAVEDYRASIYDHVFQLNDGEAMRLAIEAGMGIGLKSVWNAYESLRSGAVVEVLPEHPLLTKTAIWALYPAGRLVPPKVRAMIDFLVGLYTPVPPWELSLERAGGTT